jgi:hypothetical protein
MKVHEKQAAEEDLLHPVLKKILERGIPVWRAEFHTAINNSDNVPENYFSSTSNVPSRVVKMWWVNGDGLFCLHKGKYFIVPSASVRFAKFDDLYAN